MWISTSPIHISILAVNSGIPELQCHHITHVTRQPTPVGHCHAVVGLRADWPAGNLYCKWSLGALSQQPGVCALSMQRNVRVLINLHTVNAWNPGQPLHPYNLKFVAKRHHQLKHMTHSVILYI